MPSAYSSHSPTILLISENHGDILRTQFARYAHEYDVRLADSLKSAYLQAREVEEAGGQMALFVTESVLPDSTVYEAVAKMRTVVPTARRVVVAHWERFRQDGEALRNGLSTGKYDAYLLMPRGLRDE